MAQLIVRNLEDKVVRKLKEQAAKYGVSMEEAHRRILRGALLPKRKTKQSLTRKPKMSFGEYLMAPPYWDDDFCKIIDNIVKSRR